MTGRSFTRKENTKVNKLPGFSDRAVSVREVNLSGGLINDVVFLHGGTASDVCGAFPVVCAGATVCFVHADITSMVLSGTVEARSGSVLSGTFTGTMFGGLSVSSGCSAIDNHVSDGGNLAVFEGGFVSNTVLPNFGHLSLHPGAFASDTKVKDGVITVWHGASASVVDVGCGGVANIERNAHVSDLIVDSGGTAYAGLETTCNYEYSKDDKILSFFYISSGGVLETMQPGTVVENGYVSHGGKMIVRNGCSANIINLKKGGELIVESGGIVTNLYGQGSAGLIKQAGAVVTFKNGKEN